jgi:hypothetical protein
MALLDRLVHREQLAQPMHKVPLVFKAQLVQMEPRAHRASKGFRGQLALPVLSEQLEQMAHRAHKVSKAPPVSPVQQVPREQLAHKVPLVFKAQLVRMVPPVLRAHKVFRAFRVFPAPTTVLLVSVSHAKPQAAHPKLATLTSLVAL